MSLSPSARRSDVPGKSARFAWGSMSSADRWAFYNDEYDRNEIAERFGDIFRVKGRETAYAKLVELCNDWIACSDGAS